MKFRESLFDFDFVEERESLESCNKAYDDFMIYVSRKLSALRPTPQPSYYPEMRAKLQRMLDRAFAEERMSAYFRILDSLDRYPEDEDVTIW